MKIFVDAQYMENYGAHQEPITQRWKMKGAYVVMCQAENGRADIYYQNLADKLLPHAEFSNDYFRAVDPTVHILQDDQLHEMESMYQRNGATYKPDRIFTVEELGAR